MVLALPFGATNQMTDTMFEGRLGLGGFRYAEVHHEADGDWPGGRTQIVECGGGGCHVGFLSAAPGSKWQHWGKGEGGYDATRARFDPSKPDPMPKPIPAGAYENYSELLEKQRAAR